MVDRQHQRRPPARVAPGWPSTAAASSWPAATLRPASAPSRSAPRKPAAKASPAPVVSLTASIAGAGTSEGAPSGRRPALATAALHHHQRDAVGKPVGQPEEGRLGGVGQQDVGTQLGQQTLEARPAEVVEQAHRRGVEADDAGPRARATADEPIAVVATGSTTSA